MVKTKPKPKSFTKEKKRKLVKDKRAVSPVIAEILMVAIVVILAAVIATFVFGVSPQAATTSPAYAVNRLNTSYVSITLHDYGGAMTILAQHNVTGSGAVDADVTLGTTYAVVGDSADFEVKGSPAHIVVTANVDGSDKVVIDTIM